MVRWHVSSRQMELARPERIGIMVRHHPRRNMAMDRKSKTLLTSRRAFLTQVAGARRRARRRDRGSGRDARRPRRSTFSSTGSPTAATRRTTRRSTRASTGKRDLDVNIAQGRGTLQGIRTLMAGQSQFIFHDIGVMLSVRARRTRRSRRSPACTRSAAHAVLHEEQGHREAEGSRRQDGRVLARRLAAPDLPGLRARRTASTSRRCSGFRSIPTARTRCC